MANTLKKTLEKIIAFSTAASLSLAAPIFIRPANAQQGCVSGSISLDLSSAPVPSALNPESSARVYQFKGPFFGDIASLDTSQWGFADSSRSNANTSNSVSSPSVVDLIFKLPQGCSGENMSDVTLSMSGSGSGDIYPMSPMQDSNIAESFLGFQESLADVAQFNLANVLSAITSGRMNFLPVFTLPGNYSTALNLPSGFLFNNNVPGFMVRLGSISTDYALHDIQLSWTGSGRYPGIELSLPGASFSFNDPVNLQVSATAGNKPVDVYLSLNTPANEVLFANDLEFNSYTSTETPLIPGLTLDEDVPTSTIATWLLGNDPFDEAGDYRLMLEVQDSATGEFLRTFTLNFNVNTPDNGGDETPSANYPREIVKNIPIPNLNGSLAASNEKLFATRRDGFLTVINTSLDEIITDIEMGGKPEHVIATPDTVFVSNSENNSITAIDPTSLEPLYQMAADAPFRMRINDARTKLYFTSQNQDKLGIFDLVSKNINYISVERSPYDIVLVGDYGFISHSLRPKGHRNGIITLLNLNSETKEKEIVVPNSTFGGAYNPLDDKVLFTMGTEIISIDPDDEQVIDSIETEMGVQDLYLINNFIFVTNKLSKILAIYSNYENIDTILLPDTTLGMTASRNKGYVATLQNGIYVLE